MLLFQYYLSHSNSFVSPHKFEDKLVHIYFKNLAGILTGFTQNVQIILLRTSIFNWRNNSRKNEEMKPKQKQYPAVDVTGDRSKVNAVKSNIA